MYRTNDFPGLGYVLKRDFYEKYLKNQLKTCCSERVWHNWKVIDPNSKKNVKFDILVPDVSRIFRRPYDISSTDYPLLSQLFNRKRKTNL